MSTRELLISQTMHQPKLMQQQTIPFHNQLHPTISFGGITHQITPESHLRASMFKAPKANSYSQPRLPANNKAARKRADSEKSSAPKVQQNAIPLKTDHPPSNRDIRTAVSKWLATSQDFEKPPAPAPIADPALPERRGRGYWLHVSTDLDRRLKACSEGGKAPIKLQLSSGHANPDVDCSISDLRWSEVVKFEKEKLTPRNQRNTNTAVAVPLARVTMGPPKDQERESKRTRKASISEVKVKLEKHKQESRMQEQLEGVKENKADATLKITAKQLEIAKSKKANDEAVRAKETEEQQSKAAESKKADQAVIVRVKAKKLAADATVRHREEQERKKYVEGRARDIHENLLHSRPFDIDAVRREFSEKEVRDIKEMVRALGFGKMR